MPILPSIHLLSISQLDIAKPAPILPVHHHDCRHYHHWRHWQHLDVAIPAQSEQQIKSMHRARSRENGR